MTNHTLPRSLGFIGACANRVIAVTTGWIIDLNARIDARAPALHHRMGGWEINVSPAAQHAMRVLRADAAKSADDEREQAVGIMSEYG